MPTDDPNPQASGTVPTSSSFSDVDLSNPTATTAVVENETAMSPASGTSGTNPMQQQPSPPHFKPAPFASVGVVKGAASTLQAESQQVELSVQQGAANMRSDMQHTAATVQQTGTAAVQREWDRLRQMEEQLQRKEKQLQQRELELGKNVTQQPNFPKYGCCIKPQVYHNINADIIPPRQAFMKRMYFNYYLTCFLVIYQAAIDFGALVAGNAEEDKDDEPAWGEHFGVSMLYLLGIVFAFMLWYWPIYQAVSHRVPSKYRMAFLGLVIATLFDVVMIVGFIGHGGCGILFAAAVTDWKDSKAIVWMAWIGTVLWMLQALFFILSGYRLKKYYDEDLLRSILPTDAAKLQEAVGTAMTVIGAGSGGRSGGGRAA